MNDFKKIHDFLKDNYGNGNFHEPNYHYEYQNDYRNDAQHSGDFELGYKQAQSDYCHSHHLKCYPISLIKVINKVLNDRLTEIVDFVIGYDQAKKDLK